MALIPPEVTGCGTVEYVQPLAVSPRQACRLLSIGNTHLYGLIASGELASYRDGRSRQLRCKAFAAAWPIAGRGRRNRRHRCAINAAATPSRSAQKARCFGDAMSGARHRRKGDRIERDLRSNKALVCTRNDIRFRAPAAFVAAVTILISTCSDARTRLLSAK